MNFALLCSGVGRGKRQRTPTARQGNGRLQPVPVQNMYASRTVAALPKHAAQPYVAPPLNLRAPVMYNKVRGVYPSEPITVAERERVTTEFEADITVEETRRVRAAYWRTWNAYHARWFGALVRSSIVPERAIIIKI